MNKNGIYIFNFGFFFIYVAKDVMLKSKFITWSNFIVRVTSVYIKELFPSDYFISW